MIVFIENPQDRIINPNDEIIKYLDARYISAIKACWRLFNFGLQERSYKVERLPVHLPEQQYVIFQEDIDVSTFLEQPLPIKLTHYFEICENNKNDLTISNLHYIDFSKYFIWKNEN